MPDKLVIRPFADLGGTDLNGANLCSADLRHANLHSASLRGANLRYANLRGADLRYANLQDTHLTGADLRDADLRHAKLRGANLNGANLHCAGLHSANLRYANLNGASLRGANLNGASLRGAVLPPFQIPQEGELIVYKKLLSGSICKLRVPPEAKRTASLVGRKCRAEFVEVLEGDGRSLHRQSFFYKTGSIVRPDKYDPDPRVECTHGIHFFLTREEAERY